MSRKKPNGSQDYVLFDVHYDDGSVTSNRRVPAGLLTTLEGDGPARNLLEAQDREISERSGRVRPRISSVNRSGAKSR